MTNKLIPDFILLAMGSASLDLLQIMLFTDRAGVEALAAQKVAALSLAGYFKFEVFENGSGSRLPVCKFTVSQPAPVVTTISC